MPGRQAKKQEDRRKSRKTGKKQEDRLKNRLQAPIPKPDRLETRSKTRCDAATQARRDFAELGGEDVLGAREVQQISSARSLAGKVRACHLVSSLDVCSGFGACQVPGF